MVKIAPPGLDFVDLRAFPDVGGALQLVFSWDMHHTLPDR